MGKNGLKALMLFDWYSIKIVYICIIVMVICCGGISLSFAAGTGGVTPMFTLCSSALSTILLSSTFAMDDMKEIGVTKRSMPYTCKEIVLARYLPPAMIAAANLLLTVVCAVIGCAIHGSFEHYFAGQLTFSVWLTTLYALGVPTLFYPFFYSIGYRRTQLAFSLVSSLLIISGMTMTFIGGAIDTVFTYTADSGESPLMTMPVPVGIIVTAGIVCAYYISYRISVKKYALSDN